MREAASAQNSFGYTIEDARLKTQEKVKELMSILLIDNYPWFTGNSTFTTYKILDIDGKTRIFGHDFVFLLL